MTKHPLPDILLAVYHTLTEEDKVRYSDQLILWAVEQGGDTVARIRQIIAMSAGRTVLHNTHNAYTVKEQSRAIRSICNRLVKRGALDTFLASGQRRPEVRAYRLAG